MNRPLLLILLCILIPVTSIYSEQKPIKKVLILNSYNKGFPWTDNIVKGIESILITDSNNIEITVEYMDTKSTGYEDDYKKILFDTYLYKYSNTSFDLIINSDDNAFDFLEEYKETLFPNVPIVACGVNNTNAPDLINPNMVTGILETSSHKKTIDLILKLHPTTKKIILVVDNSLSGNYLWSQMEPSLSDYKEIKFIRISDEYKITETEDFLRGLKNDTVVIFFTLSRDISKNEFSLKEGLLRVTKASSRPVYSTHAQNLPYGVVGGNVVGGFYQGEIVGDMALRILNGEDVGNISFIEETPTQYIFNYSQLKNWEIKNSDLPSERIILNEPEDIFKKYRSTILKVFLVIILLIIIIIVLQIINFKRKKAEDALVRNQRLLSETEKLGKVGGWKFNTKTLKLIWTHETYVIHEIDSISEITFENSLSFYTPSSRIIIEDAIQRTIELGEIFDLELEIVTSKGNVRNVHTIGKLDAINNRVYGFIQDITDRKIIEKKLLDSEDRFRRAIEQGPFPMMIHADDGEVLSISSTWTELSGYSIEDIPTTGIWAKKAYGSNKEMVIEDINALYNLKNRKAEGEYVVRCSDGSTRIWDFSSISLGKLSDNRRIVISMASDITDRKKIEDEKQKLLLQLNHKNKMDTIGELAGGMAHDFNNVLSGIMSASQLLSLPNSGLNEKNLKYVNMITQASIRSSELISKLLAFSRKGKKVTTTLNINEVLNDVVEILEGTIDKKITIIKINNALKYKFEGDLSAIESAILNLGINASHAISGIGEIHIETTNIVLDTKFCDLSTFDITPGDFLQIMIKDTGCGIPNENLDKIFDPFYSTKEQGKGTGLGLSAAYGTVQDHNGSIEVQSELGKGTTFYILLPCSEHSIEQVDEIKPILTGEGTILLVDDEEFNRILIKEILESLGFNVLLAKDGFESIEVFNQHHSEIDIVLMDMIMPKMNGSEAFKKMIKIDENCKVIISSGFVHDEDINELLKLGLSGFISKPYNISEISNLLDKVMM